ncbi:MAG TPA: Xaa-Pro peptidase family protein [Gaiellaceae bacterium]|nr:Xaa-Pro peptidase family protein [Gaiellaceae bacterium]
MTARIDRLRAELERLGARSFLVSNPVNVRYLSGFESSNAVLLVGPEAVGLATDGRYVEAAGAVPGVEVVEAERDLLADLGRRLGRLLEGPVAFEADHVTVAGHEALAGDGTELVAAKGVVLGLRAVKDAEELDAIRRAARIAEDAYRRLAGETFVGRSEAELAWAMETFLHEEGAEAPSFPTIVASGPNAALPHHHPSERRIGPGETVVVDAGARVGGYCSDCTRTFATGPLPDDLRDAYALCRTAQEKALAAVSTGASGAETDALARAVIEEAALAPVQHGLGHGVGLEVHELPVLRPTSRDTLVSGNVVTVEPGVYLPGRGGVRIEDLVVVTDDGPEVLTPFTKDLLTLD